jgi:alkylation response protein AidB-like acyl-CoA dehydrogenase
LQGIRMTAKRDGDRYVINGTKTWITNGAEGSCLALLVKTNPNAQPRYNGLSLFIAPKQDGFSVGRKLPKLGYKAIDTAELVFENYRVPAENLIGCVEGRGFFQVAGGLELGRINVASRGVGIAEGALKLASEYAQMRKTFGKPICEHQAIQLKLGEMATRARAARLLTLDAAQALTAAIAATWKPAWPNISPAKLRSKTRSRACASTAPMATQRSSTSSGSIAMHR